MLSPRLTILIALLAPIVLLAAEDAKTASTSAADRDDKEQRSLYGELSKEKLKRQSEKLSDKRDALQQEVEEFNQQISRVKTAQSVLAKKEPPNLETEVKKVADVLAAMAVVPPGELVFNLQNSPGGQLINALIELHNAASAPVFDILRPAIPGIRPATVGRVLNTAEAVADESASRFPDPRQTTYLSNFTPALLNLSNRISFPPSGAGGVRRSDLEKEIAAAQAETKELGPKVKSFVEELRKKYAVILESVEKGLQEARDSRSSDLGADDKRLSDMEQELQAREETLEKRQGTLTDKLLYTEGLMLAVIVIALICLRVYPQRLAITIVQEKTLGDLLGMGLLLITIIFLAVGDFVDKSALVTLLGTLAGYIFGRRSPGMPSREEGEASSELSAPEKPEEVTPAVPGKVSLRCEPVPGAAGYRWFTRRHSRIGRFTFQKKTTEPHVILEGLKAGDSLDVVVSATNGKESKQSAPLHVVVK